MTRCAKSGQVSYIKLYVDLLLNSDRQGDANVESWPGCDSTRILRAAAELLRLSYPELIHICK